MIKEIQFEEVEGMNNLRLSMNVTFSFNRILKFLALFHNIQVV